jgi:REP element-mobilizing transposase RayT
MEPVPLYNADAGEPAYQLRYTWAGWPSSGDLPQVDLERVKDYWENDGLRLLESRWSPHEVQLAFSARPDVAPVFLAARAKGRLQHAIRQAGLRFNGFSRKVAVRSVGENTTADVEAYIARQVSKEAFVDPRFAAQMEEFTVCCPEVDLKQASESSHGRYWYNLHVVLVVAERDRITDRKSLTTIRDGCFRIAAKKSHSIARLSLVPDHLHLALRGNIEQSPQEIALGFQNNVAYMLGQVRIWDNGFYAGTFSEYDFGAIRAAIRKSPGP